MENKKSKCPYGLVFGLDHLAKHVCKVCSLDQNSIHEDCARTWRQNCYSCKSANICSKGCSISFTYEEAGDSGDDSKCPDGHIYGHGVGDHKSCRDCNVYSSCHMFYRIECKVCLEGRDVPGIDECRKCNGKPGSERNEELCREQAEKTHKRSFRIEGGLMTLCDGYEKDMPDNDFKECHHHGDCSSKACFYLRDYGHCDKLI